MRVAVIMLSSFFLFQSAYAAYRYSEMFTIPWGDSTNQLKISMPFHEDVNNTPDDSTDDWVEFTGPRQAIVDHLENIYIASNFYMQLKCFDRLGRVIYDYSEGEPGYNREIFKTALRKIYVDSLCRMYVVDGMRYDYVAVVDTAGHLLEKLSPYGIGSGVIVYDIRFNSNDILTICCKGPTFFTYEQGTITSGSGRGWKAMDGYYYNGRLADSIKIKFYKYSDPDLQGTASDTRETYIPLSNPNYIGSEFLGVDNDMNLYICLIGPGRADKRVQIYDTSYNLINEIIFPTEENRYEWYMIPYMRPSDGNIYEFRVLDDGLHVIRWSKQ